MKLYVMRHGPAEDTAATGRDADRVLSPSGRDRVRAVALALVAAEEAPAYIVSSPLVRSLQTAEIVAAATKISDRDGTVDIRRELAPGGEAVDLVRGFFAQKRKRVMLVGHEPDLSTLINRLVGEPVPVPMDKAMVVGLQVRGPADVGLRFVLEPKGLTWPIDSRPGSATGPR
jgi:phosphohistidine phosphatase